MAEKMDIKSLPLQPLARWMAEIGEPKYRAEQVFVWLHRRNVASFSEMTDLSGPLREKMAEKCYINSIKMKKRLVSAVDGTVKYLYELKDGNQVETVRMRHRHGTSLCISTQVGCRMGCRFCASTIGGLVRNLTPAEMLDQIYGSEADAGEPVRTVVLMGIGEPLDNLDNVLAFLEILSSPKGRNLGLRHVTLSTCGLVDQIDALGERKLPLTLSVSLHAPDNDSRSQVMPVNNRWPLEELLPACRRYFDRTGRRVSFEYALIAGRNDSRDHALALAKALRGMRGHVNLIPVNPVAERPYARSSREAVRRFRETLEQNGVGATVRRELGTDIAAACGQLRRESRGAGENEDSCEPIGQLGQDR